MNRENTSLPGGAGVDPADGTLLVKRTPLQIPLNLTEWFPAEKIVAWTTEALENLIQEPGSEELQHPHSRSLITLLACAYALQIFSSRDVVSACEHDPALRLVAPAQMPSIEELEHFRRNHRKLLHNLLAHVIERVVLARFDHLKKIPPGLYRDIQVRAADRLDTVRHMSAWDE